MPPRFLFPIDALDLTATVADLEAIREANPQRFEMEQLSRISYFALASREVVGFLDVPAEPFWARGHIPGRPLMPGVLMVESAAQLCSWAVRQVYDSEEYRTRFFGFGGIDNVKFRGQIFPGQSVLLLGKAKDIRPRRAIFATQGWVEGKMMFEGDIKGMWV